MDYERGTERDGEPPLGSAEFRTSPLLEREGFRHAFFTRNGGASTGPYASLSFSTVGDERCVARNLRLAAHALGVAPGKVFFVSQVHGAAVHALGDAASREEVMTIQADALVGTRPDAAVGVRTADCLPILVGDRASGAVVAIHAGWRGVVAGVIETGVEELRRVAGRRFDPVAAIGPHIRVGAFEVSEDVAATLLACSPRPDVVERGLGPKPHVNLSLIAQAKLVRAGLGPCSVDDVAGCTSHDSSSFFSFRRDGAKSGRHLSAIVAR